MAESYRRFWLRPEAALCWLVFAPAVAAQTPEQCRAAYKDAYLEQWELVRVPWEASCAEAREPSEILRSAQAMFLRDCRKAFADAKSVLQDTVDSYCAQGVAGRRRLKSQLGMPAEALPPSAVGREPSAPPDEPKPGPRGMGPLPDAVGAAKARWGQDSCMNALAYFSRYGPLNVERGKVRSDLKPYTGQVEAYYYYFAAPGKGESSPVVAYTDIIDEAFCVVTDRMKGPLFEEAAKATGGDCLVKVEVDVDQALQLAAKAGLKVASTVTAYLLSPGTWDYLYARCERGLRRGMANWCRAALPKRQRRLLERKPIWIVDDENTQAFIDGRKPKLLFVSGLNIDLISIKSSIPGMFTLSGEHCPKER